MAHDTYLLLMSLDLDGRLEGPQRADLLRHTSTCAACASAWERLVEIDRQLAGQPEEAPRVSLTAGVMARVARAEARRRWYPWLLAGLVILLLAAVASLLLPALVLMLGLYRPLLELPVVATLLAFASDFIAMAGALVTLILNDLVRWIVYLTTNPAALSVVIVALTAASIWIGMLEVMKHMPAAEAARQTQ